MPGSVPSAAAGNGHARKLSWREGLFLVGPDPLTSPYYASGALIVAGVGYGAPLFQIGLYVLLFLLAPLYIEAVLLTLTNGGTYVMTRHALSHLGKWAVAIAAFVGVVITFSYVATALVSLLSYSHYVASLVPTLFGPMAGRTVALAILLSAIPSVGFGIWVMPGEIRRVLATVGLATAGALVLSTVTDGGMVIMFAPLAMLFSLNNQGMKESVEVGRIIFLVNLVVMGLTILGGIAYVAVHGAPWELLWSGAPLDHLRITTDAHGQHGDAVRSLPGVGNLGMAVVLAGMGASILGASGVESVMNIPEELERPRRDIPKIYRWMLTLMLVIGGSLSLLLFLVLPPEALVSKSEYLLAALGEHAVRGLTGSERLGQAWQLVIVVNAALMLIGAANTAFAGTRGLWQTMARDNLLPRALLEVNERGAFGRIHATFVVAIFVLATQADWNVPKLERWYGATFGLVMFSGMVAFVLLRKYKADDRRIYRAPWNVPLPGISLPVGVLVGLVVLGYALLSLYTTYRGDMGELRTLLATVALIVVGILLLYNHRPLIRASVSYFRRVIETVESTVIETEDRTIVVAVGALRSGSLIQKAIALAGRQSVAAGIAYRQVVVFHMTPEVAQEQIYLVHADSIRPAGIPPGAVRIFTELSQRAPAGLRCYLALVPPVERGSADTLRNALDTLVAFHERHGFKGHIVLIGTYGTQPADFEGLSERLVGSTLVPVPLYGEGEE